jgi:hypothetical protein
LATPTKEARERAELKFRKKEIEAREASKAMADYQASLIAQREKTARLRALREAKEAAEAAAKAAAKAADDAGAREAKEAKANEVASKTALNPIKKPATKQVPATVRAE